MDPLNIFFLVLALVAFVWQAGLGFAALVVISRGGRVTAFGVGPGILFVVFLALGLFL